MKLISHRGNIDGKELHNENTPNYIIKTYLLGYDVEIDVWFTDRFYLGHDEPKIPIDEVFLENPFLWCHAKNIDALNKMLENKKIHCFWHQEDDVTLTSKNYIWTYSGKQLTTNSICVLPEITQFPNLIKENCYGVCSDYIIQFKK